MPNPTVRSPSPATVDLEAALCLLAPGVDPTAIAAGRADEVRRTELLAHLATRATHARDRAERHAAMRINDITDLHLRAAAALQDSPADSRTVFLATIRLQIVQLVIVNHLVLALRGAQQHPIADACVASLDAVTELLRAWHDSQPVPLDTTGSATTGERVKLAPRLLAVQRLSYAQQILSRATNQPPQ